MFIIIIVIIGCFLNIFFPTRFVKSLKINKSIETLCHYLLISMVWFVGKLNYK